MIFFKIIVLLYADDTIILADTADALQASLNSFFDYCRLWKHCVNIDKTKIIVFECRGNQHFNSKLGSNSIETVDSYKYLGVFFTKSGSFLKARKHVVEQARKALFYLYTIINNLNLPIDLQLKLFDQTTVPILTYGSEVFGFENIGILEILHRVSPHYYKKKKKKKKKKQQQQQQQQQKKKTTTKKKTTNKQITHATLYVAG